MTVDQDSRIDDADDTAAAGELGAGAPDGDDELSGGQSANGGRLQVPLRWLRTGAGWTARRLARWRLVLLIVAAVAALGLAGGLFFLQYRPDQRTDSAVAHQVVAAASDGAVAILSYDPADVDHDLAVAQSYLTGEFARYFREFGQRYVAPAVRQQDVKASAAVLRAAVAELHPDSAVVLAFIHQTITSKDKPQPVVASNNVRITLTKVGHSWLISKFEPL